MMWLQKKDKCRPRIHRNAFYSVFPAVKFVLRLENTPKAALSENASDGKIFEKSEKKIHLIYQRHSRKKGLWFEVAKFIPVTDLRCLRWVFKEKTVF